MKNDRMFNKVDDITPFTDAMLKQIGRESNALVKMRNNMMLQLVYDRENQCFHTEDWGLCWNNDGSSVNDVDMDIVELIERR